MKTNATYRLRATAVSVPVLARKVVKADSDSATAEPSEWWHNLPAEQKKDYIEQHPNSKYAEQAIKEGQEQGHEPTKGLEPGSEKRKGFANDLRKASGAIAATLKKTFPMMHHATGALKNLTTGKPLDHHQKEVLTELGHIALKTGLSHVTGGVHSAEAIHKLGVGAVSHAIEKFKEHKSKNAKKDDVETFVDAVADGIENAPEAPIPAEHAKPKSSYRTALGKHVKSAAAHTTQVLNKSFKQIKPATEGLHALATKKPLQPEQKQALKSMGKFALGTVIATLPGGLVGHLAAGAGAAAVTHAYKKVRAGEGTGNLVHRFVESIGEGLEHALLHHATGHEGHEGGGHEGGGGE